MDSNSRTSLPALTRADLDELLDALHEAFMAWSDDPGVPPGAKKARLDRLSNLHARVQLARDTMEGIN